MVQVHSVPRRSSSTSLVAVEAQRGQLFWVGNMWLPQLSQRLPMRRGEPDGKVKTPSATGTWLPMRANLGNTAIS
jgi:hypothetical protein